MIYFMNNKKKTLILIILFIILMVGSTLLYNNLITNYKMDSLVIENNLGEVTPNNKSEDTTTTPSDHSETNENTANKSETTPSDSSESTENQLTQAPNFTVYDLDQNEINLSDFFGKPIIINFWASWCGPCQMEMPDFNEAYTAYQNEIEFLMVNMTDGSRETLEKASSFIKEKGYSFPVYYDTKYSAAITYSVSSLPTTYFIDAKGNLIAHAKGAINAETLQKGIDMIYEQGGQ